MKWALFELARNALTSCEIEAIEGIIKNYDTIFIKITIRIIANISLIMFISVIKYKYYVYKID